MYCGNCGSFIPHGVVTCPNCGVQAGAGTNYCKNCGAVLSPGASFCSMCGYRQNTSNFVYPNVSGGKSRLAAGILGVLLGGLGVHNFYLGYISRGIAQIIVTVFTFGMGSIWGFVEGVLLLCGSYRQTDARGYYLER